jgi:hypothetical protein
MDTSGRIPWAVLGIAEGASFDDARRAFRRLAKAAHPDLGGDPAIFASLVDAFRTVAAVRTRPTGTPTPCAPRLRPVTPYDWANLPPTPAPRIWAEKAPDRPSATRPAPCFADILARELAHLGAAAA